MVLAHAGGVDEAAVIVLPILIFAGFLLAERRVRKRELAAEHAAEPAPAPERAPEPEESA